MSAEVHLSVSIALPCGTTQAVALSWNEKTTGTEYSLDVSVSFVYTGACTSASTTVPASSVRHFRICSTLNGDWTRATCGGTDYDGRQNFVDVAIP